jgi:hypothetical protein
MRRLAWITLIAGLIAACATPPASPSASVNAIGILMVSPGDQVQARPPSEDIGAAFGHAVDLADANGDDLGYPWIDPATGELVLSVVTQHGRELVDAAGIAVAHRIRAVAHGATELRRIQDDVTFLHSRGVPNSELIYETIPDQRDNRALIVISALSPPLLDYLASHYPADALAVIVDPTGAGGGTT